ncbi:Histone acetyltransferase KAT2A [Armadillidium nasatum]|uniref:Histone acetyltransferase KAT2A n=1 Tax=Armadillidium nasatum TaxID=96803 RepID=A0A5N5TM63_9CRUS|nr:Histone acetyltransferase KAT2A [Armadillidium nasatum]
MQQSQNPQQSQPQQSSTQTDGGTRTTNSMKIQMKKAQMRAWPREKKIEKIACYSACKINEECRCTSFKIESQLHTLPVDGIAPVSQPSDTCGTCGHTLAAHTGHLENKTNEELDKLLSIVVDVENLYIMFSKEENNDTKHVYHYLFRLFRKSAMHGTYPVLEGPLGKPPFERPSIAKGVTNFVHYKCSQLPTKDIQVMTDLAKMFLHCLNHWKLVTPSLALFQPTTDENNVYKVNYTRWLCFSYIPQICDTLPHCETSTAFGRNFLKTIYHTLRKHLMDRFRSERDKMSDDKKHFLLHHFPRRYSQVRHLLWDIDYNSQASRAVASSGDKVSRGEFERLSVQPGGEGQFTTVSLTPASAQKRSKHDDRYEKKSENDGEPQLKKFRADDENVDEAVAEAAAAAEQPKQISTTEPSIF